MRIKGIAKATNKNVLKEAQDGSTWVKKDENGAVIIELNSETDFTANNSEFIKLAEGIVDAILSAKVKGLDEALKLKMPNGSTVEENCLHLSSITGEKIVMSRMQYFPLSASESAACYRHNNGKMSTILILDKNLPDASISGLAVHYAANNPKFITRNETDEKWINEEKEVIVSNLKKENKPEQFHQKIVEERIKKLLSQVTFLEQAYLYDSSKTIGKVLEELGANIKSAVYYGLGASS